MGWGLCIFFCAYVRERLSVSDKHIGVKRYNKHQLCLLGNCVCCK